MKYLTSFAVLALGLTGNAVAQPQFGRPGGFAPPQQFGPPPGAPFQPGSPFKPATTTAKPATSSVASSSKASSSSVTPAASSSSATPVSSSTSSTVTTSSSTSTSAGASIPVAVQTPLAAGSCNTASSRGTWCNGLSVSTDDQTTWPTTGNVCAYDFVITNTTLSLDGTPKIVLAINGQVPGPAIECNWGDTVQITVTNQLQHNGTSIHFHGIRQLNTNYADGAAGITECPLAPGQTKTYTWTATQYGSSWYHSHYATQYADGVRGPIIIHGPATANYDVDMGTVMVDDIWYQTSSQVYSYVSHVGGLNANNYVLNGHNTNTALTAGAHALWQVQANQTYLFRIVNSAAQNSWWMHFDNHVMTVIAMDMTPIQPYTTEWLAIGTGQRYDVLVTANQAVGNYFFRAVAQTSCAQNSACLNTGLGSANGIIQYAGAPTVLPTSTSGTSRTNFATCQDEPLSSLVPYIAKSAGSSSAFSATASTIPGGKVAAVQSSDDGSVFKWYLNNGVIDVNWDQPTLLDLAQGNTSAISNAITLPTASTWVYFVIQNQFLAAHPMHLHGHSFAVLGQGSGTFSSSLTSSLNFVTPARRDTAMLPGSGWTVIGFYTDNPGAWLMHCHIAWHIDGGLGLQYIEVPSAIPASTWVASNGFQSQCAAYEAYEAAGGAKKSSGESGLKARNGEAVRKDAEKRFLGARKARRGTHL